MKKIKNTLLSVLLFAFTFLVMHDFVIDTINGDTKYELSCHSHEVLKVVSENILDVSSQVHDSFHTVFDTPINHNAIVEVNIFSTKPQTKETISISHIHFVPQRPPLV